jgi:hypothetical protein
MNCSKIEMNFVAGWRGCYSRSLVLADPNGCSTSQAGHGLVSDGINSDAVEKTATEM